MKPVDAPPWSAACASVWALVSGFPRAERRRRLLLMLQAHIDESVGPAGVYAMAGYIASAEKWAEFSDEWQQFLDMKPSIDYFRFSEAMGLDGQFRHWREDARDEKMALLSAVIGDHATASIACALKIDEHQRVFGGDDPISRHLKSPYFFLLYGMIDAIAKNQHLLNLDGSIDFVFDEQVMEKDKIVQCWDIFKLGTQAPQHLLGDTPIFRDDKKVRPLQAADMLAGRMRTVWETDMTAVRPHRIPVIGRQRAVTGLGFIWTEQNMRDIRAAMSNAVFLSGAYGDLPFLGLPQSQP